MQPLAWQQARGENIKMREARVRAAITLTELEDFVPAAAAARSGSDHRELCHALSSAPRPAGAHNLHELSAKQTLEARGRIFRRKVAYRHFQAIAAKNERRQHSGSGAEADVTAAQIQRQAKGGRITYNEQQ